MGVYTPGLLKTLRFLHVPLPNLRKDVSARVFRKTCLWGGRTGLEPHPEGPSLRTAPGGAPLRHFRCTQGLSGELAAVQELCLTPSC